MFSKEDFERIKQKVDGVKDIQRRAVKEQRLREDAKQAEQLRQINEAEAKFRATGVVTLFEALRDQGVVTRSDEPVYQTKIKYGWLRNTKTRVKIGEYQPASVHVSGTYARIAFDYESQRFGNGYSEKFVSASLEGDLLVIEGKERMVVGENLSMVQAVEKAILKPGFYSREDTDRGL